MSEQWLLRGWIVEIDEFLVFERAFYQKTLREYLNSYFDLRQTLESFQTSHLPNQNESDLIFGASLG